MPIAQYTTRCRSPQRYDGDDNDDGDGGDDGEPVVLPLRLVALLPIQARSWRSKSAALEI